MSIDAASVWVVLCGDGINPERVQVNYVIGEVPALESMDSFPDEQSTKQEMEGELFYLLESAGYTGSCTQVGWPAFNACQALPVADVTNPSVRRKLREGHGVRLTYNSLLTKVQAPFNWSCESVSSETDSQLFPQKKTHPRSTPKRSADLRRWKATWQTVRSQVQQGKPLKEIERWLASMHTDLACGQNTLRKIVKAGEKGLLD